MIVLQLRNGLLLDKATDHIGDGRYGDRLVEDLEKVLLQLVVHGWPSQPLLGPDAEPVSALDRGSRQTGGKRHGGW